MAEYMFMLYGDESWYDEITPENWEADMALHGAFTKAVEEAGATITGGAALERTTTATTLQNKSGDPTASVITDGPFMETKEALGGFYLIDARDLDQALELAAQCPSTFVEVRPVMNTDESPE
ncbi:MAG: hypothetical protein GEU79_10705 [Acidimicrobiia bacterium]|nr:hypothetical protein [Acidimicrobiia bacterium]